MSEEVNGMESKGRAFNPDLVEKKISGIRGLKG